MSGNGGFSSLERDCIRRHHRHEPADNQCSSVLVKHIKAPVPLVRFSLMSLSISFFCMWNLHVPYAFFSLQFFVCMFLSLCYSLTFVFVNCEMKIPSWIGLLLFIWGFLLKILLPPLFLYLCVFFVASFTRDLWGISIVLWFCGFVYRIIINSV